MNKKTMSGLFIALAAIFGTGFACGDGEGLADKSTPQPSPVASSGTPNASTPKSAPNEIAGNYDATGKNPNGSGSYTAKLVVTPRDDVYQFSWVSNGRKYDGVGVVVEDRVAVSFADGSDGTGCGVVLYKIGGEGTLDGVAGYWGTNSRETETAKRKSGTDLDGEYDVTGKNTKGESYSSPLSVSKDGAGYRFKWGGSSPLEGFGVRDGDFVSVGFGGKSCSFVAYGIKSDGTLDGKWGGAGLKEFGTETALKK